MLRARCVVGVLSRWCRQRVPVRGRVDQIASDSSHSQSQQLLPRVISSFALYHSPPFSPSHRRFSSAAAMSGIDTITERLAKVSIKPSASVSHAGQASPAEWRKALSSAPGTPKDFELLKTLVFKPKTAKSATTVPVVIVAREETDANAAALGKKLNLKEMRLANADLLKEFFSLDKDSRTSLYYSLVGVS
jgi:hypothetical protein